MAAQWDCLIGILCTSTEKSPGGILPANNSEGLFVQISSVWAGQALSLPHQCLLWPGNLVVLWRWHRALGDPSPKRPSWESQTHRASKALSFLPEFWQSACQSVGSIQGCVYLEEGQEVKKGGNVNRPTTNKAGTITSLGWDPLSPEGDEATLHELPSVLVHHFSPAGPEPFEFLIN